MVGGMISSAVLTLLVIPAIYTLLKQHQLASALRGATGQVQSSAPQPTGKESQ
jgi:Cu(I)/Ag(I) efflux system membrane protein CusA/SilA